MPRYRRRRTRVSKYSRHKNSKYSNETFTGLFVSNITGPNGLYTKPEIIPTTSVLGTRKAKNFTVEIFLTATEKGLPGHSTSIFTCLLWALVYVPEGTNANDFHLSTAASPDYISFYEPNQNVIMSGIVDNTHVCRLKSKLARNLNSGDTITLVLYDPRSASPQTPLSYSVAFSVNYALSFS